MLRALTPNIDAKGRRWRAVGGSSLAGSALIVFGVLPSPRPLWGVILAALLLISGGFMLFEAWQSWCVLRACGIRTPL